MIIKPVRLLALLAGFGFFLPIMSGAVAQQVEPASEEPESPPATRLEVSYTGDVVANLRGGYARDVLYLDNVDVAATLDLERLVGWRRTTLFVYGLGNQGDQPTALVGDVQGTDNIETVNAWRIYEAFLQRRFLAERLSILAGLYDLNSEFDVLESALVFMNSSFGMGADFALSRSQGPSTFPFTSLGVRARALPHDQWYVQAAALDGVPGDPANPRAGPFRFASNDGLLLVAETGWLINRRAWRQSAALQQERLRQRRVSRTASVPYRGKLGLGLWYYTARFDGIDPASGSRRGNMGAYLLAQWRFYHERNDPDQGLRGFLRLGMTGDEINRIAAYTGGGLVVTGLLPRRAFDQFGVGMAVAHNGPAYKRMQRRASVPVEAAEITLEATYSALVFSWLTLQGDVQYVLNPNTDPLLENALVTAIRMQVIP